MSYVRTNSLELTAIPFRFIFCYNPLQSDGLEKGQGRRILSQGLKIKLN